MVSRLGLCAVVVMALAGAAGTASGCSVFCSEDRQVLEIEYGPLEDIRYANMDALRGQGYSCRSDGAIRNAFGNQIGIRYVCTKCD